MPRREFPKAVRVAAFERSGGQCENPECRRWLMPGDYQFDHEIPDGLTGQPTLENAVVLCSPCHLTKTATHDVPAIARAKRREKKFLEVREPSRAWPKRPMQSRPFPKRTSP